MLVMGTMTVAVKTVAGYVPYARGRLGFGPREGGMACWEGMKWDREKPGQAMRWRQSRGGERYREGEAVGSQVTGLCSLFLKARA